MAASKGKNTKPEMLFRKFLYANGNRFKLHDKSLPGNPVSFYQNTILYYLYMAVFGMVIRTANTTLFPKQELTGGRIK